MITAKDITLKFGSRTLFEDVNIKFSPGNCYGLIGANGSGKSTFLKILTGDVDASKGEILVSPKHRISFLRQNHYEFDEFTALDTVIMGHKRLYDVMKEKDAVYAKEDFSDEDGVRAGELECEFAELEGWEAESNASQLLDDLGIDQEHHYTMMSELEGPQKVRVLLAQALFGNPDILIMDEPTNHLDVETIMWLEEFLIEFENTVIVVSHDRQFLNKVCTHIADIDYGKIQLYAGNYEFWRKTSELLIKQMQDQNRKTEEKMEELKDFIRRFSANASKAKQATSRKNTLAKLSLEEIKPSTRKSPYIDFKPNRDAGVNILEVEKLNKSIDGELLIKNFSLSMNRTDKIAFVGQDSRIATTFFQIIMGELEADSGSCKWGETTTQAYFPKDNSKYFNTKDSLVDWLREFTEEKDETYVRSFLGKMLFSGNEALKSANVLSGGEKVRCMLAKMMSTGANVLVLDEPTNHLDLESITALNEAIIKFPGPVLFVSQDHQFIQSIANRIVEITPNGWVNKELTYEEYIADEDVKKRREMLYKVKEAVVK